MTQPKASPETMARLCEAIDQRLRRTGAEPPQEWAAELAAYRAETTPPLRSRASVDAELVAVIRAWAGRRILQQVEGDRIRALCVEPTAPELAPDKWTADCGCRCVSSGPEKCPGCHLCSFLIDNPHTAPEPAPSAEPYRVHDLRNTFTDHDQDTREERPCGCEESDALKLRIERLVDAQKESRRLLRFALDLAQQIVQALETTPDA